MTPEEIVKSYYPDAKIVIKHKGMGNVWYRVEGGGLWLGGACRKQWAWIDAGKRILDLKVEQIKIIGQI